LPNDVNNFVSDDTLGSAQRGVGKKLGEEDLVGARATVGEREFGKKFGEEDLVGARAKRGFRKKLGE